MSGPLGSSQWMYASGGYEINQSLRLNDNDNAHLTKTFASAGNRRTYTFSAWVKTTPGITQQIFVGENTSTPSNSDYFQITSGGVLRFFQNGASSNYAFLVTNQLFRDPASWYHILVAVDTTQGTAANRVKIYVNGSQVTSFSTETYPNQNIESYINNNVPHGIGAQSAQSSLSSTMDGYLAEVNFIDGAAKAPADFGETDATFGHWKPIEYDGTYGTNGFYLNFKGGGIIAANGGTITTDGDYKVHSFTSNGTFTPTSVSGDGYVEYLIIAGGGGGGAADNDNAYSAGGGGAGGYLTGLYQVTKDTDYALVVGDGGAGGTGHQGNGANGSNSTGFGLTAIGGGGGGSQNQNGADGGSGGGAGVGHGSATRSGGTATSGQGNDGGDSSAGGGANPNDPSGGGGGAGGVGAAGSAGSAGGAGLASTITGSSVTRAGGGGGSRASGGARAGGDGGGGAGGNGGAGGDGSANTGGGGGAGVSGGESGSGGSGIVIIRYKFQ